MQMRIIIWIWKQQNPSRSDLFEAFFPAPSSSCLRPRTPSCSTAWLLGGSVGRVAAFSVSLGGGASPGAEGPVAPEMLSSGTAPDAGSAAESSTDPSNCPELGSTGTDADWGKYKGDLIKKTHFSYLFMST